MEFTEAWNDTCSSIGMVCRMGDKLLLEKLIKSGKPVDVRDNRGWRPLHEAAAGNHHECLEQLLSSDLIDINWRTYEGETALFLAAAKNNYECVKLLLEKGADCEIENNSGMTVLMAASGGDNIESVRVLLENNANVNSQDIDQWTPVHFAAKAGNVDILKLLFEHKASLWSREEHKRNSIFIATESRHLECVKFLVNRAKDQNENNAINTPAFDNATALGIAAQNGDYDCLVFLLENGADPNFVTTDGFTALHLAADVSRDSKCMELLLNTIDVELLRQHPNSATLQLAVINKNYNLIQTWLEKNLPPDAYGKMMLHLEYNNLITDTRLRTPLSIAAEIGDKFSAEMLLNGGSNPKAISDQFIAPLVAAVIGRNDDIVKLLLRANDVEYVNSEAQNCEAFFLSILRTNWSALELLLKAGLDNAQFFRTNSISTNWPKIVSFQTIEVVQVLMTTLWIYIDYNVWCNLFKMVKTRNPSYFDNQLLSSKWKFLMGQPHTLQHLCRLKIRSKLTPSQQRILCKQVNLPDQICNYILYKD